MEQTFNVRAATPQQFDDFITALVEVNEQNVDRRQWQIHHRWRAINAALTASLLVLNMEAEGGTFRLELVPPSAPTPETEEKSSTVEEKTSAPVALAEVGAS